MPNGTLLFLLNFIESGSVGSRKKPDIFVYAVHCHPLHRMRLHFKRSPSDCKTTRLFSRNPLQVVG